ncbi:uncharacterized protein LOC112042031 [Lingula anatina]|uniref:Uncharacterized protein LOC112042031 n=1 Tax=Lingula anatina TaxID=7574 RepID=A0A2R2MN75_LINAN|nr:uncharacterized protein LOC112042031 [Lingula anatina]|eukprot:XP_023931683.1 uncharacterized protein LOC112042031 [Lingula anatina]
MAFLKHFAKPGVKRKVLDLQSQEYERKRIRKFQSSWQHSFSWLVYDTEANTMHCKICRSLKNDSGGDSPLIAGTSNFKIDVVRLHAACKQHQRNSELIAAKSTPISQSVAADCLGKLKRAEYTRLVSKFRSAHAIAKHHLSFNLFKTFCKLDTAKGLGVGTSHTTDKSAAQFVSAIANVERRRVIQKIESCKFLSLTMDVIFWGVCHFMCFFT